MNVFMLTTALAAVYVRSIPLQYRSPLQRFIGRGGGRLFINRSWIDVSRAELRGIFATLTDEEVQRMHHALHDDHADAAQHLLADAAIRFFRKQGRVL